MFRPPTKYSEYLQDVRKSIDYILKRVNATTVTQIIAGTNVTISPASGTGVVTINASGGGATPTLAQVTRAGNTTTNAITVGGFTSNASSTIVGAAAGTIGTRVLTVEGSLPEIWFKDTFSAADSFVLSKYGSLFYFARTSSTGVFINYAGAINPSGASWSFGHGGNPTATVHIKGADVLSSTKALLVQNSSPTDLLTIWNDGAVGINTSTNAGYKLDVNGTARVSGNLTVDTNTLFVDATNNRVGIGTTTPTAKLHIKGTGDSSVWVTTDDFNSGTNTGTVIRIGTRSSTGNTQGWIDALNSGVSSYGNLIIAGFGGNVLIGTSTDAGYKLDVNGIARVGASGSSGQLYIKGFAGNGQYLYLDDGAAVWTMIGGTNYSIQYNGTSRLTVTAGGNVGIGTSNPLYKLHVTDSAGDIVYILASTGQSAIIGATGSGTNRMYIGYSPGAENISITSNGVVRLNSITSGNVLIGTTTDAGYKLDIDGTFRATGIVYADSTINQPTSFGNKLLFMNSGNYSKIALADSTNWSLDYHSGTTVADVGYHRFYTGSTLGWVERLRIENNGNVGIGTTTPTDKLHIVDNTNGNKFARISAGGTDASAAWVVQNDQVDNVVYRVFGSAVSGTQMGISLARSASLLANLGGSGKFLVGTYSSTDFVMGTGNQERMRLVDSTGNFLVGTTTDLGNKLEVSGTVNATAYKINNVIGYTGILNIPTNPPGQQNIDIQSGIVVNIF